MNRADIIRMAREVGAVVEPGLAPIWSTHTQLYEFAALVAAAERKTCEVACAQAIEYAKSAEREALAALETDAHFIFNNPPGESSQNVRDVIEWYAASIRARSA